MKNILFLIVGMLLFTSCLTDKKISKNCDRFLDVCGTPEVVTQYKDTIVHVYDTIQMFIPQDTVIAKGIVYVDGSGQAQMEDQKIESDLITSTFGIVNGQYHMTSYINKKSIPLVLNMDITIERGIRETKEVVTVKVKYIPKLYKIGFWVMIIELSLIALFIVDKIKGFGILSFIKKFI